MQQYNCSCKCKIAALVLPFCTSEYLIILILIISIIKILIW